MHQKIEGKHETDPQGNPSGGTTTALGIEIHWQNGDLGRGADRKEPNGAFVEGVIAAALNRIQFYQKVSGGQFACRENSLAITKLEEALHWCQHRTAERENRGVEGTHAK